MYPLQHAVIAIELCDCEKHIRVCNEQVDITLGSGGNEVKIGSN